MQEKNYYEILQVHRHAKKEVIEAAYKALMKIHHPDKGGDEEKAKEVNRAYEVLSEPDKKRDYDRAQARLAGKIVGDYRLIEEIAKGGFGTTYKGEHVFLKEPVCIKHCSEISEDDERILVEETKAMWDLRHFAIPAVRNILQLDDGSFALVMSFIPGLTLEKVVQKVGRLDPEHVAWITERMLNVLQYIHFHGIVHGDIKPQNIIIQPKSHTVVLVDFGLSMIKPTAASDGKGYTEYFAPPEQKRYEPLLPQSDFYSLGITMLYMLNGGNIDALNKKEVPRDTPDPLCNFIKRLIVRDILSRPSWNKENLFETLQRVRAESFGRGRSNMKPIPGID